MNGFKITYNGKPINVSVEDGLLIIHIDKVNEQAFFCVGSVEYNTQYRNIWHDFTPLELGDTVEICMTDIENISPPIRTIFEDNIVQPISKLEGFYKLEALLKEKGLL